MTCIRAQARSSWFESIVWGGGAVTAGSARTETDPSDLSRISLYSWQLAQRWQNTWVVKSPQGASCKEYKVRVRKHEQWSKRSRLYFKINLTTYTWLLISRWNSTMFEVVLKSVRVQIIMVCLRNHLGYASEISFEVFWGVLMWVFG